MFPCCSAKIPETLQLCRFRPVELSHRPLFERYFNEPQRRFCDFNFTNLYCWGRLLRVLWTIHQDRLIFYNPQTDLVLMPLGPFLPPAEMLAISNAFRAQKKGGHFVLVPEEYLQQHPAIADHFHVQRDEDNADYIYTSEKLVELKGNVLMKKRNLINQFQRNYPDFASRAVEEKDFPMCLELADTWGANRQAIGELSRTEMEAMRIALEHFRELRLQGVCVHSGTLPIAFAIFSEQAPDTVTVHYEKYDRDIKGAGQIINRETARHVQERYAFINREQDMGIPGLRRAKMSYLPDQLLTPYILRRK